MRIGIDARFYSSSATGIGRYTAELIDHLLKIDTKNHYTLFFNDPHFDEFTPPRPGVEKVRANIPHYSFAEQWKYWRILSGSNLDVMHFTHFNAPILYRKPSVVTIHDLTLTLFPGKKMVAAWHRLGYNVTIRCVVNKARRIIAVSEHTAKDLTRLLHVDRSKIRVIHEGVSAGFHPIKDAHLLETFREDYGLTKPYLLYTGVWRNHKNLVNLIRAFGILKRDYDFPGWLVITGKEDPWYPEVRQTVAEEKLEGEVRFTGLIPEEDLVLLYNAALVYVLPSLYEGFGLPALEAFASGVPLAASQSSSLPEICGENNAVFFDPKNPQDIAQKIADLIKDKEKMAELRERGLARAKDFSWEKMAHSTLATYNEVKNELYPT